MKRIKIKPELLSLLTTDAFRQFESEALIEAYRKLPTSAHLNLKQVQQFVFRNLERFVWAGLAVKVKEGKSKHGEYQLTELFHTKQYDIGPPHFKNKPTVVKAPKKVVKKTDPLLQLKEQLNAHKLDLLTIIAETEEYEELSKQLPSQVAQIQELYNDARNRYSKVFGKIKAIESLISRASL